MRTLPHVPIFQTTPKSKIIQSDFSFEKVEMQSPVRAKFRVGVVQ